MAQPREFATAAENCPNGNTRADSIADERGRGEAPLRPRVVRVSGEEIDEPAQEDQRAEYLRDENAADVRLNTKNGEH